MENLTIKELRILLTKCIQALRVSIWHDERGVYSYDINRLAFVQATRCVQFVQTNWMF